MATKKPVIPDYHTKPQTQLRLSEEARELLDACTKELGVGKSDVVEIAIRLLAKKHSIAA